MIQLWLSLFHCPEENSFARIIFFTAEMWSHPFFLHFPLFLGKKLALNMVFWFAL